MTMTKSKLLIAIITIIFLPIEASVQTKNIKSCTDIKDDIQRLSCFDSFFNEDDDSIIQHDETKGKLDLLNYEFLHQRNMLFGTPEYVIEKIHELKSELNLQNLQVWSNFPGVKHEDCMKSIKMFTEKVMPHFKDDLDTDVKKVS